CGFLYDSGYSRYLHSFPTRRSSDLRNLFISKYSPCRISYIYFTAEFGGTQVQRCFDRAGQWRVNLFVSGIEVSEGQRLDIFDRQDRKSTRLNSSHVKISYAVFCLKK